MARLAQQSTFTSRVRAQSRVDYSRWLLVAVQYGVVGGIGLYIVLAIINTVAGAPVAEAPYSPYEAR